MAYPSYYDEYDDREFTECWECLGEGGWHNCGEDCCCCIDPEGPPWDRCQTCDGTGRVELKAPPAPSVPTDAGGDGE